MRSRKWLRPQPVQSSVGIDIGVRIDMKEISTWPPENIIAFFEGIGRIVKIKEPEKLPADGLDSR